MTNDNSSPRKLDRDSFRGESPSWTDFVAAVQTWTLCQQREVTIGQCAAAFNVDPITVQQAVLDGYWMDYQRRDDGAIERAVILLEGE